LLACFAHAPKTFDAISRAAPSGVRDAYTWQIKREAAEFWSSYGSALAGGMMEVEFQSVLESKEQLIS
jgi:hypothetical protein